MVFNGSYFSVLNLNRLCVMFVLYTCTQIITNTNYTYQGCMYTHRHRQNQYHITIRSCDFIYFISVFILDGFSNEMRTPCVVFCGHPSLRFGDAVHLVELWGKSSANTVVFTGNPCTTLCISVVVSFCLIVRG